MHALNQQLSQNTIQSIINILAQKLIINTAILHNYVPIILHSHAHWANLFKNNHPAVILIPEISLSLLVNPILFILEVTNGNGECCKLITMK